MNTSFDQGSARIYQFPVGGRSGVSGQRHDEIKTSHDLALSRVNQASVGGAWYHDAAIQESKPVRER
jgi:Protein of unknown function (DUF2735)